MNCNSKQAKDRLVVIWYTAGNHLDSFWPVFKIEGHCAFTFTTTRIHALYLRPAVMVPQAGKWLLRY